MKKIKRLFLSLISAAAAFVMLTTAVTVSAFDNENDESTELDILYPTGGFIEDEGIEETPEDEEKNKAACYVDRVLKYSDGISYDSGEYNTSSDYLYQHLNVYEKAFYDKLKTACEYVWGSTSNISDKVTLSGTVYDRIISADYSDIGFDRAYQVYYYFKFSNPKYFFISNKYGYSTSNDKFYLLFMDRQGYDFSRGTVRTEAKKKLLNLTDTWMNEIDAVDELYDKEQLIISKICAYLTYDDPALSNEDLLGFDQSVISGVLNKTTVCAGYAMMTAYFCNAAGIESFYVNSSSHAWNMVNLYGNWYELDNTWYDSNRNLCWVNKSRSTFLLNDKKSAHELKSTLWEDITLPSTVLDNVVVPERFIMDNSGTLTKYTGSARNVVIPVAVGEKTVTAIGGSVFEGSSSLLSIKMPDSVTSIGEGAFKNCRKLVSMNVPAGVVTIGNNAFYGCSSLGVIDYDGTVSEWEALVAANETGITVNTVINCTDGIIDERPPKNITILSKPNKLSYFEGEELELDGCKVVIVNADGVSETLIVTDEMVSGYNKDKIGSQSIKITYKGKSVNFSVTVKEIKAESIEIADAPTLSFYTGDAFTVGEGTLSVKYNNGTSEVIAMNSDKVTVKSSSFNPAKVGTYSITVTCGGKSLKYDVDVSVDPERAHVTLESGEMVFYYDSLVDAFKKIDSIKDKTRSYKVNVIRDITEKSFTFPTYASALVLETKNDAQIFTASATLSPKCSFEFNADVVHINSKNEPSGKHISIKAATGTELKIKSKKDTLVLDSITGSTTSTLKIYCCVQANTVSSFGTVVVFDEEDGDYYEAKLLVLAKLASVDLYKGDLSLRNANVNAAIKRMENGRIDIYSGAGGKLPKFTVGEVQNIEIFVWDYPNDDDELDIYEKPIFTLAQASSDIYIEGVMIHNQAAINGTKKELKAVPYGKEVRAEWVGTVTLNDVDYSSPEKAFEAINHEMKQKNAVLKDYTISLNKDVKLTKLMLPTKAGSITLDGNSKKLELIGVTSITPKYAFTLSNISIDAHDKNNKTAALTINASLVGAVNINDLTFAGKSLTINSSKDTTTIDGITLEGGAPLTIKGGSKNNITITDCPTVNTFSGFATTTLTDDMAVEKSFSTDNLDLGASGNLILGNDPVAKKFTPASVTIKKLLTGETGSKITLSDGFKPITISGNASGSIALTGIKVPVTTQILNSSKCALGAFDVTEIQSGTGNYALTRNSAKVYCQPANLDLDGVKFVTFADVVNEIENDGKAIDYTVTLDGDYANGAAFKFPKAGTYELMTINLDDHKFTFTGNITLTGNTVIEDGTFYAEKLNNRTKEYEPVKYTISSAKDKSLTVTGVDLGMVSSIGLATSNITLNDVTLSVTQPVQIKAKAFEFSSINGIIETITANSVKADGAQSIKLLEKKQNKVTDGFVTGSGNIAVTIVDKYGNAVTKINDKTVLFTKFGTSADGLSLANDGFKLNCDVKGKVTVAAS